MKIDSTLKSSRSNEKERKTPKLSHFQNFLLPSTTTSASSNSYLNSKSIKNIFGKTKRTRPESDEESASDWSDEERLLKKRKIDLNIRSSTDFV